MSDVVDLVTKEELESVLAENSRVVVDFHALATCVPCQRLKPHFEKAAENVQGTKFVAVDLDKSPWAVSDYGVMSVPTVMLFEDGKYVKNVQERTAIRLIGELS